MHAPESQRFCSLSLVFDAWTPLLLLWSMYCNTVEWKEQQLIEESRRFCRKTAV
jgi:hypothetical protein